jgi:hypothetical protein
MTHLQGNGSNHGGTLDVQAARVYAEQLLARAGDRTFELAYIKGSRVYRANARLKRTAGARLLLRARSRSVIVRALGDRNPKSRGTEVWLLRAAERPDDGSVPWDFVLADSAWSRREEPRRAHGQCLVATTRGEAVICLGPEGELLFLRHPWSGKVEVRFAGRSETIDLYSEESDVVRVRPGQRPMLAGPARQAVGPERRAEDRKMPGVREFTRDEQRFIEQVREARPPAVAVCCPSYLGVTSSTINLFEFIHFMPGQRGDDPRALTPDDIEHHARILAACGCDRVVFSGGDDRQHALMRRLRELRPGLRADLFLHASYPQFCEDLTWTWTRLWFDSARRGEVHTIASAKMGYERFVRSLGLRGAMLLNRVRLPLREAPDIPDQPRRVGVWLSGETYRKIPHAMIAAVRMIPGAVLHGSGLRGRAGEVAKYLGVPRGEVHDRQLNSDALFEAMRRTHLTMYVTFIECCPMLPLESLHNGVPAIIGPNSHLFEDEPYLFERLVVPFPERAEIIAEWAARAIAERHEILAAYRKYHPRYEARAQEVLRAFLNT